MQSELRVILYGAGLACRINIDCIPDEWFVIAIADKNEKLWGDYFNGKYEIIPPSLIKEREFDCIVIMTWKYKNEIRRYLTDMGIDPWRIVDGGRYTSEWDKKMYYQDLSMKKRKLLDCKCKFENRSKGSKKLLYVLIGYKEFLWDDVLPRLYKFCPPDIDVCLVSGGLYNERLSEIAEKYQWSYLGTDVNDVIVSQNIVISYFKNAELIYKMDEDVYVTNGAFEKLESIYNKIVLCGELKPGYIGPIIPMHSSSYIFLEEFGLKEKYKDHFDKKLVYGGDHSSPDIRINPEYPKWYWSQGQIDKLNIEAEKKGERYKFFPCRYAICFILFSREFFEDMGGFEIDEMNNTGSGWNGDEAQIMKYCSMTGKLGIVALNVVCGHFCYLAQETEMKQFRATHRELFELL